MSYLLGEWEYGKWTRIFSIPHYVKQVLALQIEFERGRLKRGFIIFYHRINILKANMSSL